jgi:hypothetical protein
MRRIGIECLGVLLMIAPCCMSAANRVQLKLEERTTVHVGQIATLLLPSARPYDVEAAGEALIRVKSARQGSTTVYRYRAARPGNETLLVVPWNLPFNHCVSCVTRHYFVTVLP